MCTKGVLLGELCERQVVGISVIGGLLVLDEDDTEDESVINDLVPLEGVTGVTMRVLEVLVV